MSEWATGKMKFVTSHSTCGYILPRAVLLHHIGFVIDGEQQQKVVYYYCKGLALDLKVFEKEWKAFIKISYSMYCLPPKINTKTLCWIFVVIDEGFIMSSSLDKILINK